jgi:inosose dehydratase
MGDLGGRIAGAPITWGVDGSPGWGYLMDRDRVMTEMAQLGLSATEIGPDGYLPRDPDELRDYMARYDMQVVSGFVHAVLHCQDRFEAGLDYFDRASRQLAATGAEVLVLGANSHLEGYDTPVELDETEWRTLAANLRRLQELVTGNGLTTAVHPHWGMAIAGQQDVERLLESSDVDLCLDTGHLYVAGADPVAIAELAAGRVAHVHLKDVDGALAERVRTGEITFKQATLDGMFTAVGDGDVDIAGVIDVLEGSGYQGWYVLEQDVSLDMDPAPGQGPVLDAEKSVRYLGSLTQAERMSPR